jgi:hypothetical protein
MRAAEAGSWEGASSVGGGEGCSEETKGAETRSGGLETMGGEYMRRFRRPSQVYAQISQESQNLSQSRACYPKLQQKQHRHRYHQKQAPKAVPHPQPSRRRPQF